MVKYDVVSVAFAAGTPLKLSRILRTEEMARFKKFLFVLTDKRALDRQDDDEFTPRFLSNYTNSRSRKVHRREAGAIRFKTASHYFKIF
jgi:hypothetical protein